VENLVGDRDGGLDALAGKSWDAVIDTCGYVPRIVRASAEFLKDQVQHYVIISTISVYDMEALEPNSDENAKLATMEDETNEEITNETYGALKVLCENAVEEIYPENSLIVRPGLVVGPHDPSNRFTYWTTRADRGGEILAHDFRQTPSAQRRYRLNRGGVVATLDRRCLASASCRPST
jgi:2'-hydroxyisoflavone reductase